MAQQTAVEWLYQKIKHIVPNDYYNEFQKAKVIEREQIIDAYNEGEYISNNKINAEQYYTETYNK